ncbi:ATP-dependent DNA helicase RRM3-like [Apium graveolens]|uniref:ATP-dependent DNA helicase RRM3-like n=1 Tax=Apium graveolens TaxID=4045 RepID=UPI003D7C009A
MVDNILLRQRKSCPNTFFTLNDTQLQFYVLGEIDELLRSVGKSLKKFDQLPQPPRSYLNIGTNNLIIEETSYDTRKMEYETAKLLQDCTEEQRKIYDAVIQSIDNNVGGIFFVYGNGGCGKTFLWRTLICKLRSEGKIMLPVACSGIAATLLPGGRTAHSRFKIPIVLDECSSCNIAHDSDIAQLIKQTQLIIWDEAPMHHSYAFEFLDRLLKDIIKAVDPECYNMPFGGITIVLGGDFHQILPIITYEDRADIVVACESDSESEELIKFAKWVLDIGNGQVSPPRVCNSPLIENQILIPSQFCDLQTESTVDNMICSTYPNFSHERHSIQYLSEIAILTPTNQTLGHLNSLIVDKLPGESMSYFSVDAAEEFGGLDEDLNEAFPIEYLNFLNASS